MGPAVAFTGSLWLSQLKRGTVERTELVTNVEPPTFDKDAIARLAERTEYEARLLEAIYRIVTQELFPKEADSVIYPIAGPPQFIAWLQGNIHCGDWRPGFLDAGAPLVFITTFKPRHVHRVGSSRK